MVSFLGSKWLKSQTILRSYSSRVLRDKKFYESEGKDHRRYFYVLDHRGLLFLEESKFRNYATCLKDKTFLDFFFKQLRVNTTTFYPELPFVSLCGKEQNFLSIDDSLAAVVFGDMLTLGDELTLGFSNIKQSFDPALLCIDHESGRLYHPILNHKHLHNQFGLLNQSITDLLSAGINTVHVSNGNVESSLIWKGHEYKLKTISNVVV